MTKFLELIACVAVLCVVLLEAHATQVVPEVDAAGAAIAIGLVSGLVALVRGRRQRR